MKTVTATFTHTRCNGNLIPIKVIGGNYYLETGTNRVRQYDAGEAVFKCDRCERKGEIADVPQGNNTRSQV